MCVLGGTLDDNLYTQYIYSTGIFLHGLEKQQIPRIPNTWHIDILKGPRCNVPGPAAMGGVS